jgi:hypothetical protein
MPQLALLLRAVDGREDAGERVAVDNRVWCLRLVAR